MLAPRDIPQSRVNSEPRLARSVERARARSVPAWIGLTISVTKRPSKTDDPVIKVELLELASVREGVACNIEDHLTGGWCARTDGRLASIQLTLRRVSLFGLCRDIPRISGDRFCDPVALAV
jgi:hypothetical protein